MRSLRVRHNTFQSFCAVIAVLLLLFSASCGRKPSEIRDSLDMSDGEKRTAIEQMLVEYRKEYSGVPSINVQNLVERVEKEDFIIVDVRAEAEQDVSSIPDSIPGVTFEERKDQYRDQTIVTYCTIGLRSGKYALKLQEEGLNL